MTQATRRPSTSSRPGTSGLLAGSPAPASPEAAARAWEPMDARADWTSLADPWNFRLLV
jgi:hypothetical protein